MCRIDEVHTLGVLSAASSERSHAYGFFSNDAPGIQFLTARGFTLYEDFGARPQRNPRAAAAACRMPGGRWALANARKIADRLIELLPQSVSSNAPSAEKAADLHGKNVSAIVLVMLMAYGKEGTDIHT